MQNAAIIEVGCCKVFEGFSTVQCCSVLAPGHNPANRSTSRLMYV